MFPSVGNSSKYPADAFLTAAKFASADVPPITNAKWYGGQAAVPKSIIFSRINVSNEASFNNDFVF